jgi:hypothetical protein
MAIRIVRHLSRDEPVSNQALIEMIERNRDRLREIANMGLTVSSLMISTCFALLLYAADKSLGGRSLALTLCGAALCFFSSAFVGIFASLLRRNYAVSSEAQFIEDLLSLFRSELHLLRLSFLPACIGFILLAIGIISVVLEKWR